MEKHRKIEVGQFIISEPFLQSLYFDRSVVLIVRHDENGTIGFMINRVTDLDVSYALEEIEFAECPLFFGGPIVTDIVHFLHRIEELPDSTEIAPGLYWGGDVATLVGGLNDGSFDINDVRFFAGHASWAEGQLDTELDKKSWVMSDLDIDAIFSNKPDDVWGELLTNMGSNYAVLANFPFTPSLN